MRPGDYAPARYLVEWYTPHLSGRAITDVARCLRQSLAAIPGQSHRAELLYTIQVPQDEYAFSVFAAESAEIVAEVCQQAGLPADRVTSAVEADPPTSPVD